MIKINLAPGEARRRGAGLKLPSLSLGVGLGLNLGVIFAVAYILAAAGVGFAWWGLRAQESRLSGEIARGNQELASLKVTLGQGANVKAQLADFKKRVELIEALMKGQSRPIVMFDAFADVVPQDLWITGMEERDSVLKVTGSAFSTIAVSDLLSNLRSSGRFKEIDIVVSRQELAKTPSMVTFEVTCRFES
jgi:Tfp pilus assembly protein PilN